MKLSFGRRSIAVACGVVACLAIASVAVAGSAQNPTYNLKAFSGSNTAARSLPCDRVRRGRRVGANPRVQPEGIQWLDHGRRLFDGRAVIEPLNAFRLYV